MLIIRHSLFQTKLVSKMPQRRTINRQFCPRKHPSNDRSWVFLKYGIPGMDVPPNTYLLVCPTCKIVHLYTPNAANPANPSEHLFCCDCDPAHVPEQEHAEVRALGRFSEWKQEQEQEDRKCEQKWEQLRVDARTESQAVARAWEQVWEQTWEQAIADSRARRLAHARELAHERAVTCLARARECLREERRCRKKCQ